MVDIEYIRKKHFIEGWTIRKISRNLQVSRQSVRKALKSSEIPKYNLSSTKPCPVLDPYKPLILEWLEKDKTAPKKQQHTARRIFERLRDDYYYPGSESTVRRFVQLEKKQRVEMFIPLTADWGEQAQVDWGRAKVHINGKETEVSLFCLRLKASLVPFVWASPTEKLEAFLEGHKLAFEWLGGIPATLVYDNPKTAVTKILKGPHREEHTVFSSLRAHYLFDSEFCNPASGNEKGTVENLVKFVRRNAMVPVPSVKSINELNQKLIAWCDRQRQVRIKDWEQERQELMPLPPAPFKCSRTKMVSTSRLLLFEFDRNYYSVPVSCGQKSLRVESFVDRIEVYDSSKLVALHDRCYSRGERIMQLDHYLPLLAIKPRAVKNALVVRKLPEVYQRLRNYLCKRNPDGYREFAKILLLNQEFNFEYVLQSIEEALKLNCPSYSAIRQILVAKMANSQITPTQSAANFMVNVEVPVDSPSKFNRLIGAIA